MSILGTTGIESERQGLVAGLLTTAQQIGAAIGVGVASVATALLSEGASPPILVESYRYALLVSYCWYSLPSSSPFIWQYVVTTNKSHRVDKKRIVLGVNKPRFIL